MQNYSASNTSQLHYKTFMHFEYILLRGLSYFDFKAYKPEWPTHGCLKDEPLRITKMQTPMLV